MSKTLLCGLLAMGVSSVVAPLAFAGLRRWQVLDHPSERSSHAAPVPRGGGIAPAAGALAALALSPSLDNGTRWGLAVACGSFGLLGLIEDVVGVRALSRLSMQFVASAVACSFLLQGLTGSVVWRGLFAFGALFWLVAFANAYNFMDGIDGISVAQAVVAGTTWFLVGTYVGSDRLAVGGAIVAGAAIGFAPYNLPHARMFLGDVGSYAIGAWLAAVALAALRAGVRPEAVLAPLALYVADTGTTLVRRLALREAWYSPHRDHAYQRLHDAGRSHLHVSALVGACIAACGALGGLSLNTSSSVRAGADLAVVGVISAYILAPRWLSRSDSQLASV